MLRVPHLTHYSAYWLNSHLPALVWLSVPSWATLETEGKGKKCAPIWDSQVALAVKQLPANAGDVRNVGLIPGSGRSSGGGHGKPLQYSYLESPMGREDWQAIIHRGTKSCTWLKQLSMHVCASTYVFYMYLHHLYILYDLYVCVIYLDTESFGASFTFFTRGQCLTAFP